MRCVWGGRELSIIADDDDDSEKDSKNDSSFYLLLTPDRDCFHSDFRLEVETILYTRYSIYGKKLYNTVFSVDKLMMYAADRGSLTTHNIHHHYSLVSGLY